MHHYLKTWRQVLRKRIGNAVYRKYRLARGAPKPLIENSQLFLNQRLLVEPDVGNNPSFLPGGLTMSFDFDLIFRAGTAKGHCLAK